MSYSISNAKFLIAKDYLYGLNGKEQNLNIAYEYITSFLKEGLSSCSCRLMGDYYEFIGLSDESYFYHLKAAELGNHDSQYKMAFILCSTIHNTNYDKDNILKGIGFYKLALDGYNSELNPQRYFDRIKDIELSIDYYTDLLIEKCNVNF